MINGVTYVLIIDKNWHRRDAVNLILDGVSWEDLPRGFMRQLIEMVIRLCDKGQFVNKITRLEEVVRNGKVILNVMWVLVSWLMWFITICLVCRFTRGSYMVLELYSGSSGIPVTRRNA